MRFNLTGTVDYSVGSCCDGRKVEINQSFYASSRKAGIKEAKKIIMEIHKRYYAGVDYGLSAKLYGSAKDPIIEISAKETLVPSDYGYRSVLGKLKVKKLSRHTK
ncbi:MAG: hypothetical protein WC451_06875 [Patescibacteria group bacterium]|jgi:hypothetical protein